jgi:hypothetical protein
VTSCNRHTVPISTWPKRCGGSALQHLMRGDEPVPARRQRLAGIGRDLHHAACRTARLGGRRASAALGQPWARLRPAQARALPAAGREGSARRHRCGRGNLCRIGRRMFGRAATCIGSTFCRACQMRRARLPCDTAKLESPVPSNCLPPASLGLPSWVRRARRWCCHRRWAHPRRRDG